MEYFLIYLYTVLLKMYVVPMILVTTAVVLTLFSPVEQSPDDDYKRLHKKIYKPILIGAVISTLCVPLVPSKTDLAYIIGGGVVWKVAQDEQIQKLPHNVAKMANDFMEQANKKESTQ